MWQYFIIRGLEISQLSEEQPGAKIRQTKAKALSRMGGRRNKEIHMIGNEHTACS